MPDFIKWRFWINSRHNRTEFHFNTNAESVISVQVIGRKEWILVSPGAPLSCYPFTNCTMLKDEMRLLRNTVYYKSELKEGDLLYVASHL